MPEEDLRATLFQLRGEVREGFRGVRQEQERHAGVTERLRGDVEQIKTKLAADDATKRAEEKRADREEAAVGRRWHGIGSGIITAIIGGLSGASAMLGFSHLWGRP